MTSARTLEQFIVGMGNGQRRQENIFPLMYGSAKRCITFVMHCFASHSFSRAYYTNSFIRSGRRIRTIVGMISNRGETRMALTKERGKGPREPSKKRRLRKLKS
jgi:hypothetical protein